VVRLSILSGDKLPEPGERQGRAKTTGEKEEESGELASVFITIEFWYSIPTVFKIGQLQSEYSPGIITVGIQSETFFVVRIQLHCVRV
jgi:hypothetical protein